MKKLLLIAPFILLFVSCIMVNPIAPSGKITTETIGVNSFSRVEVGGGIELIVYNGEQEVLIETHDNIHKHIDVYVSKNCLYIKPSKHINFRGGVKIKAYVTNDIFSSIDAGGGSKVIMPEGGIVADYLDLNGSGGSRFEGDIECRALKIDISGGGKANLYIDCASFNGKSSGGGVFNLEGLAERMELDISGGGVINAFTLASANVYANLSGGAVANVRINGPLSANLTGGSTLKYKGDPEIHTVSESGGSRVVDAN